MKIYKLFIMCALACSISSAVSAAQEDESQYKPSVSYTGGDDMQQVYDFVKKCGTYFIATLDVNQKQPRVRPFGTINIFDGKLYIQTGKIKRVAKQIAKNNNVEICAYQGAEWIRIECKLVEDNRIEAQESMLKAYPSLAGQYKPGDGNTVVYYMKDAKAYRSSFSNQSDILYQF